MQLKLFTPTAQYRQRARRGRPSARKSLWENRGSWDLWTQQPEQEQEMTLLFLDIRDFTPLAGSFQAFEVIHLVKKLILAFQRIVRSHRGRIIETTGDGFYAAFGFHEDTHESVANALAAGRSILKCLETMNAASFERNLGRKIDVGIGVHAGKVAMSTILLAGEPHLMVMGHAVNIAARIQNATKALDNNFLVSASALALTTDKEEGVAGRIALKGVANDFEVRLLGKSYR